VSGVSVTPGATAFTRTPDSPRSAAAVRTSCTSVQATSNLIGIAEIAAGVLIVVRPWSAVAAVVGSLMAVATFVITLTFLLSTPGWEPSFGGFPALSVAPGQFILKDAALLGAAIWSLGESLRQTGAGE
jgi:reactive chlorine resistance protein C